SQGDKIAVAEKAVYYHQEDKISLIGNPSVSQGKDTVKGRLITLYISQGRSVVEGGGDGPVHAILHPSKKE
ncbi:MAG: LptA/OstA family protein, partial [Acidobacteriota bacterium]